MAAPTSTPSAPGCCTAAAESRSPCSCSTCSRRDEPHPRPLQVERLEQRPPLRVRHPLALARTVRAAVALRDDALEAALADGCEQRLAVLERRGGAGGDVDPETKNRETARFAQERRGVRVSRLAGASPIVLLQ